MKSITFGLLLFVPMALLYFLLNSDSGQLKDEEFRIVVLLLAAIGLMLVAGVVGKEKPRNNEDWEKP